MSEVSDPMLTCESIWELLSVYADNETAPDEAAMVERHVAACPDCARDLAFMRRTSRFLSDTPDLAPPTALRESILSATVHRPAWQERLRAAARSILHPAAVRVVGLAGAAVVLLLVILASGPLLLPLLNRTGNAPASPERIAYGPPIPTLPAIEAGKSLRSPTPRRTISAAAARPRMDNRTRIVEPSFKIVTAHYRVPPHRALTHGPVKTHVVPNRRPASRPARTIVARQPRDASRIPESMEMASTPASTHERETEMSSMGAPPPSNVHIQLAAINQTVSADHVSSLADLRRAIRRDNEATRINPALFRANENPEVVAPVIKARF